MYRKIVICLIVCISFTTLNSSASEPNDYIIPGRALLFNGSLSGIRSAYQTFDNGLNDTGCAECSTSRELKFLHAVAHTAMLVIKDDNGSIDSVFELAKRFGVDVLGDYWSPYFDPCGLGLSIALNQHDAYQVPPHAPDINDVFEVIDTWMIPEINGIIDDLNSISDSPEDRFRIFFEPNETKMFFSPDLPPLQNDVEVDYAEVLFLKGLLIALKAELQSQLAYDVFIDANDLLIEKIYGDCFSINMDLLLPHPDLLKVLPTVNDSNDGAAILAQVRQRWIEAINYYLDTIDYIREEEDSQEDDLLYIDPNDKFLVDMVNGRLITLRNSLESDTIMTYPVETTKTYDIYDVNSVRIGQLILVYNFTAIEGDDGSLTFTDTNLTPSPWEVEWFGREDVNRLEIELEYYSESGWGQGWFEGTLSNDSNSITGATFEYWGDVYGALNGLSGHFISVEVVDVNFDPNPIFGDSMRYPDPVNPRDLLPVFDQWNGPQPGTVGHGLGDDPTLGGILPDMTQYDWRKEFDKLQPGGLIYLDYISSSQISIDGDIDDWDPNQLIFTDISDDTENDSNDVNGVDIKNVYLAYNWQNLYGAIETYDEIGSGGEKRYSLFLDYSPNDKSSLHSLNIEVYVYGGVAYGSLYYNYNDGWDTYWQYITDFTAASGQNAIEFTIPFDDMPDYLPGRFITVESEGWDSDWYVNDGEENLTHLKIGEVGTISGTVAYNGFKGDPIFVHAYTDPEDPEESVVATTMITEPGPYTLEGIGLGWHGFVRAFTPLFGFDNPFELGAFKVQTSTPVFVMYSDLDDVDVTLNYPVELKKDVLRFGEIDSETREVDWYYFDAVAGGTYTIDLTRGSSDYACMTLYGRDGYSELQELEYWETQQIIWLCPTSGRYYIKVANDYYEPAGGIYQIQMTSNINCPQTDIACDEWPDVKDCKVDFYDLAVLVSQWLNSCSEPFWCEQTDFNQSGSVSFADFVTLANEWLQEGAP